VSKVVVPDDQLSLESATPRRGQNVRLAAQTQRREIDIDEGRRRTANGGITQRRQML